MADIFISYARVDSGPAEALARALTRAGFSVWWDRQISAGAEFSQDIERELLAAKAVLVLWSSASVQSRWVRDEADSAHNKGTLVPLLLEKIEPPMGFRQTQSMDFSQWGSGNAEKLMDELVAMLTARFKHPPAEMAAPMPESFKTQRIRYCRSADGVSLAYALMGEGTPVVKAGNMLTHIELDARSFAWRHVFDALARKHLLVRYDIRGMGLSQRKIEPATFEDYLADLEAVVDAAGLERFALLGFSQGCPVSMAYAAKHPERVTCLALTAAYVRGWRLRLSEREVQREKAFLDIVNTSWDEENPFARQMFTSSLAPRASRQEMDQFNELLRQTTSAEKLVDNLNAMSRIDLSELLPQLDTPTCLFHVVHDTMNSSIEEARTIASELPNADLVALDGGSHLILEDDAVWPQYMAELGGFLTSHNG